MRETTKGFARCTACGKGWPDVRFRVVGGGILCERCDTPSTTAPQAPVAGADPRADGWRALAAWLDTLPKRFRPNGGPVAVMPHEDTRTLATALRAAAEAVTDLGARLDRACEIAKECNEAQYRAELALHEATQAAAARGAEGERERAALRAGLAFALTPRGARMVDTLREYFPDVVPDDHALDGFDPPAPRASAGPAAWEEGPSGFDVGPVAYTNADALRDGLAARERAREREGAVRASDANHPAIPESSAARASDDPAPTTPDEDDEPMTFDEVFRGASVVGVRRDAAPAAPEVPRADR